VGAEQRPVAAPCLRRLLVEPVTDEGEQLGGFEDHVISEVGQRDDCKQDHDADCDPDSARRSREFASYATWSPTPAAQAREEAGGFGGHAFRSV